MRTPNIKCFSDYGEIEKALLCAYLCQIVYLDRNNFDWQKQIGIDDYISKKIKYLKYKSIEYTIFYTRTHQFLVIRGCEFEKGLRNGLSDLWINLCFFPIKINDEHNIYCHSGYVKTGNAIWNEILKNNVIEPNLELVICGHSLGGALVKYISKMITGMDFSLYTFASPQVANDKFYNYKFNVKQYHFVNENDVLIDFPSILYRDSLLLYKINKDGEITYPYNKKMKGLFYPLLILFFKHISKSDYTLFDDHSITAYIMNLHKVLGDI